MVEVMKHAYRAVKELDLDEDKKESIVFAALLHDIDYRKFFGTKDYANARKNLDGHPSEELIIEMIDLVFSYKSKDRIVEPQWKLIPRYCDRLEDIGDIGIIRVTQFNITKKELLMLKLRLK